MSSLKARSFLGAILAAAVMAATSGVALADSPHFVGTPTATKGTNSVTASFKAAGLGTVSTANFTLSATGNALYGCFTKSGNHPQATNKEGPTTVSSTGDFPVRGGQTTGSLTISLPSSTLVCPPGQNLRLISGSLDTVPLTGEGLPCHFGSFTGP
jgi:hypothetical protein